MTTPRFAVAVGVLALLVMPTDAHAYLDPGTGSLIIQGLLAALFGAAFTIKLYWGRLKAWFAGTPPPAEEPPAPEPSES